MTRENQELQKVVMLIDKVAIKYLGEQKFYNGFVSEREIKNRIEMTFLTSSLEGFARWYMMIGDHAEVISPAILKTRIKEITTQIYKKVK